ncbi:MAG: hypothetical protein K6B70_05870 [Clostridia bacterium]|nr:hypothetical protein [Clostridia bacterium]
MICKLIFLTGFVFGLDIGFCAGMLAGLHIKDQYIAKHIISKHQQKREREKIAEIKFSKWVEELNKIDR